MGGTSFRCEVCERSWPSEELTDPRGEGEMDPWFAGVLLGEMPVRSLACSVRCGWRTFMS